MFSNCYRIEKTRSSRSHAGEAGIYFVTLCCHQRKNYFGSVVHNAVQLTEIGCIAHNCWSMIPMRYPHVSLDTFVVMPNHLHGLIEIQTQAETENRKPRSNQLWQLQQGSLYAIVQAYKAAVKRICWYWDYEEFKWQSRHFEQIVPPDGSLNRIRQDILNNPRKWTMERNNPSSLWM